MSNPTNIPILVMLCGLPGCGKSTVAKALQAALSQHNFAIVSSDETRKQLFPDPTYSDEENSIAHGTVQQRIITHLQVGRSVIHDATNLREPFRRWRHEAVRATACRVLLVSVELDDAEARRRIVARAQAGSSISDADLAIYELMRGTSEPIPSPHAVIHNDDRFDADLQALTQQIERQLADPAPIVTKRKVFAYITHGTKLLVFKQPNAPEAGIQVPAGTVETGEDWEAAALREAQEETGLDGLVTQGHLGHAWRDMTDYGKHELHHRVFYHLAAPHPHAERWQHWERFSGDEQAHHLFELFWVELDAVPELIADHGVMLPELRAALTN